MRPLPSISLVHRLILLGCVWVLADFLLGLPVAWKMTRTEPWVRVGDPELHHTLRPMSHQTEQYGPIQGQIFVNSLGAKDEACREVPLRVPMPRVALFGDSFAEGWGLPFAETVPGQLRKLLFPAQVDVLGFGIASYCPSLTERWMRRLLAQGVHWDLAVLLIDPGDFYDEMDVRPFLEGHKKMTRKDSPLLFRLRWYEYSLSYQVFRRVHDLIFPAPAPTFDLHQAIRGNEHKIPWMNGPESVPWFSEGKEQSARAVEEMQTMAVREGFSLWIVVYPYPRMMAESRLRNEYTDFWREFSQKKGLPFFDLSPLFMESGRKVEEIYRDNFLPGDFHWNANGSSRIARLLLPEIQTNLRFFSSSSANKNSP